MNVVRYFILIVVNVKQCSKRSQIFPSKSGEVKQHNECSQGSERA